MNDCMKKKEHFVPQFYLKNFANTNGFLDIYDCNTSKFKEIQPNNICYENYLYETKWCNANKRLGKFVLEKIFLCNMKKNLLNY